MSEIGKRSKGPAGFTLIEVLAAFAILVTALIFAATLMSRNLSAVRRFESSLTAHELAHAQLIQALYRQREQVPLEAAGERAPFSWQVSGPQELAGNENLQLITAQVDWEFRGQPRSLISTIAVPVFEEEEAS